MPSWSTDPSYMTPSEEAYEEGKIANARGDLQSDCPHSAMYPTLREAWLQGWQVAQLDRVQWEAENHERAARYGDA